MDYISKKILSKKENYTAISPANYAALMATLNQTKPGQEINWNAHSATEYVSVVSLPSSDFRYNFTFYKVYDVRTHEEKLRQIATGFNKESINPKIEVKISRQFTDKKQLHQYLFHIKDEVNQKIQEEKD